jgi:hypothetical protein
MSPKDKRMGSRIAIKPLTSLQRLMISGEFDFFIIVVIIANCIFMALESPVVAHPLYTSKSPIISSM